MAKCHLKINVYHSSDYISFLIFVYGVYNLFTNFGNMSQKTKCQNCVKQRNPAETKDSGCQKTHKIHTCPDRYLIGRKKTVDPSRDLRRDNNYVNDCMHKLRNFICTVNVSNVCIKSRQAFCMFFLGCFPNIFCIYWCRS